MAATGGGEEAAPLMQPPRGGQRGKQPVTPRSSAPEPKSALENFARSLEDAFSALLGCSCPQNALRLWLLSAQVVLFHSVAATLTEYVFSMEGFRFGWVYAMGQFLVFCICPLLKQLLLTGPVGVLELLGRGDAQRSGGASTKTGGGSGSSTSWSSLLPYFICGAAMTVSHGAGTTAYVYLNYTTTMLFKSAKVPMVLLGSGILNRQVVYMSEYLWAVGMMFGLVCFGFGDRIESPKFHVLGLLFVSMNLLGSTVTCNLQQLVLQGGDFFFFAGRNNEARGGSGPTAEQQHASGSGEEDPLKVERLLFYQYMAASLLAFLYTSATGELASAISWYGIEGWRAAWPTLADNVLTYLGLEAVMWITAEFDATRANVVCSGRKAFTFVFSYFLFPKAFGFFHAVGISLTLFCGYMLQRVKLGQKKLEKLEDRPGQE